MYACMHELPIVIYKYARMQCGLPLSGDVFLFFLPSKNWILLRWSLSS